MSFGFKIIPKAINNDYIISITITIVVHMTDVDLIIICIKYIEKNSLVFTPQKSVFYPQVRNRYIRH